MIWHVYKQPKIFLWENIIINPQEFAGIHMSYDKTITFYGNVSLAPT